MNETGFWLTTWSILTGGLVAIIFLSTSYYDRYNQKMLDMVKAGASPIEASCALGDRLSTSNMCILEAIKKENGIK